MQQPVAADNNDVAINAVALQQAGQQSVAQSLLNNFLAGGAGEGDGEGADANSLPEADIIGTYDEAGGIDYVPDGATGPAVSDSRGESAATELLRKQLLGKNARENISGRQMSRQGLRKAQAPSIHTSKPRPRRPREEDSSDDDEGGRSRVGKKGRQDAITDLGDMKSMPRSTGVLQHQDMSQQQATNAAKKGSSYLDQVLSERSAKQQKKKQRKQKTSPDV